MAADALAPCVARSSAAMLLIMQDKLIFVFHEEGYQELVWHFWEMINDANIFYVSSNKSSSSQINVDPDVFY